MRRKAIHPVELERCPLKTNSVKTGLHTPYNPLSEGDCTDQGGDPLERYGEDLLKELDAFHIELDAENEALLKVRDALEALYDRYPDITPRIDDDCALIDQGMVPAGRKRH